MPHKTLQRLLLSHKTQSQTADRLPQMYIRQGQNKRQKTLNEAKKKRKQEN